MIYPMIFWHGWSMHPQVWTDLMAALQAKTGIPCHAPPLPGYDNTPLPPPDQAPSFMERLMSDLPERFDLCGWSMGAMLALAAAAQYPERIRRLILFSGTPRFIQGENWSCAVPPIELEHFAQQLREAPDALLDRFNAQINHQDHAARRNQKTLQALPKAPLPVLLRGLELLATMDLRDSLPTIHQPTLLLHGAHDLLMPLKAAEYLASRLPHAKLVIVPHTAHAPFLSKTDFCVESIATWIQGHRF